MNPTPAPPAASTSRPSPLPVVDGLSNLVKLFRGMTAPAPTIPEVTESAVMAREGSGRRAAAAAAAGRSVPGKATGREFGEGKCGGGCCFCDSRFPPPVSVPASGGRGVLIKPAVSSSIVPLSEPFPFMRPGDENGARAFEAGVARLVGVARGKWAEAEEAGGRVDAVGSGSSICRTVCIVSPVALHSSLCPQDVTTCSRDQKLNK